MQRTPWRAIAVFGAALQLSMFVAGSACSKSAALVSSSKPISRQYFGMHIHESVYAGLWPAMPFGAWRLSDTHVAWPDLEPSRDQWSFERLDRYIQLAQRNGVEVLLPLAHSPTWASARPKEPSAYGQP